MFRRRRVAHLSYRAAPEKYTRKNRRTFFTGCRAYARTRSTVLRPPFLQCTRDKSRPLIISCRRRRVGGKGRFVRALPLPRIFFIRVSIFIRAILGRRCPSTKLDLRKIVNPRVEIEIEAPLVPVQSFPRIFQADQFAGNVSKFYSVAITALSNLYI